MNMYKFVCIATVLGGVTAAITRGRLGIAGEQYDINGFDVSGRDMFGFDVNGIDKWGRPVTDISAGMVAPVGKTNKPTTTSTTVPPPPPIPGITTATVTATITKTKTKSKYYTRKDGTKYKTEYYVYDPMLRPTERTTRTYKPIPMPTASFTPMPIAFDLASTAITSLYVYSTAMYPMEEVTPMPTILPPSTCTSIYVFELSSCLADESLTPTGGTDIVSVGDFLMSTDFLDVVGSLYWTYSDYECNRKFGKGYVSVLVCDAPVSYQLVTVTL